MKKFKFLQSDTLNSRPCLMILRFHVSGSNSFERRENVLYVVAPLSGGKIQNAIWPKIWMSIFILGQNKSKQAKKISTRPDPA